MNAVFSKSELDTAVLSDRMIGGLSEAARIQLQDMLRKYQAEHSALMAVAEAAKKIDRECYDHFCGPNCEWCALQKSLATLAQIQKGE